MIVRKQKLVGETKSKKNAHRLATAVENEELTKLKTISGKAFQALFLVMK